MPHWWAWIFIVIFSIVVSSEQVENFKYNFRAKVAKQQSALIYRTFKNYKNYTSPGFETIQRLEMHTDEDVRSHAAGLLKNIWKS